MTPFRFKNSAFIYAAMIVTVFSMQAGAAQKSSELEVSLTIVSTGLTSSDLSTNQADLQGVQRLQILTAASDNEAVQVLVKGIPVAIVRAQQGVVNFSVKGSSVKDMDISLRSEQGHKLQILQVAYLHNDDVAPRLSISHATNVVALSNESSAGQTQAVQVDLIEVYY